MPTVNNRRLLPLNGVMPMDAPGGDKENEGPTEKEVPEEKADPSDDEEEEEEEASEYESEDSSSSAEMVGTDEDDPETWNKSTLVQSIKYAYKQYEKLKERFQKLLDQIKKLNNDKTNLKVKNQTSLASKNTMISNLRNQLKLQAESKAVVRQEYEKKFQNDIENWKGKAVKRFKENQDMKREVTQLQKDVNKAYKEKDIAKRKATAANLDWVESNKQVTELKKENKRLKKELDRKTDALAKVDQAKIEAQLKGHGFWNRSAKQGWRQRSCPKMKITRRSLSSRRKKQRQKKEEDDKMKLKEQQEKVNTKLDTIMRSTPAARQPLPNNDEFHGANQFMQVSDSIVISDSDSRFANPRHHQLLQTAQQMLQAPADTNNLANLLGRLGGGSSSDDASFVTQPPAAVMSPPQRQLTLTQMDRERTPDPQEHLPRGVRWLTDNASGTPYYRCGDDFYMSYESRMEAVENKKTGESTISRRDRRDQDDDWTEASMDAEFTRCASEVARAHNPRHNPRPAVRTATAVTPSQMSDLTITQKGPMSHQSMDTDTEEDEDEY